VKIFESDSSGIKSDLKSCDVKIQDLTGALSLISLDENSYRVFKDIEGISCEFVEEGVYINCSDIQPVKITSKYQDSINTENKIDNFSFVTATVSKPRSQPQWPQVHQNN
jgi:hypothetical protein